MIKLNLVFGLFFISIFAISQEEYSINKVKSDTEIKTNDDWLILFDGSSFDHWRGYLSDNMFSEWNIIEGAMVFTPGKKGKKNIITKEKFTNFKLSLEWKISEGGNSGIFWAVVENEKFSEPYETGPEIQVLDNERHPDSFLAKGKRKAGSIYDILGYPEKFVNSAGQWNLCELEINHKINQGKITMNGGKTIIFPLYGNEWDKKVTNSKFKDWEGFYKNQAGHIGLQDHGDKVWFRNIKIKEL